MSRVVTLAPIRPSAAIEETFYAQLHRMVEAMQRSISWWLVAAYRAKPPEMAADAAPKKYVGSPSRVMQRVMARLSRKWQSNFNDAAPEMAKYFTTKIAKRNAQVLAKTLRKGGISVKMQMTPRVNDVLQASMAEQVSLIKSIASEHLAQVEGLVMRSVAAGGDLGTLSDELQKRYGVTERRAAFIATDQNAKATAMIARADSDELGITEAIWKHSHAGKTPRPSHVKMDGQKYNIKEGMWDEDAQKFIWPGYLPRCRCYFKPILPRFDA